MAYKKKTDPVKKKKTDPVKKKKTDPVKKKAKASTPASRNKAKRKAYLDKAYKNGIDTTDVRTFNGRTRIHSTGGKKTYRASRAKPVFRATYKNTKGSVTNLEMDGQLYRDISRGYKKEKEGPKKVKKKK